MARNDSLETGELTDTSFYILLALTEERHGYLIMKFIEELTGGSFSIGPASMYTTIKKLAAAELIRLAEKSEDGKKTYLATEKGFALLRKDITRREAIVSHGKQLLQRKGEIGDENTQVRFQ